MAELIPYLSPQEQEAILDGPALAPPEGVIPQFDNPPNNNALAHGVLSACVAISTVCLLIRAYARVFLFKQLKIEDYLIVVAYANYLGWIVYSFLLSKTPGYFVHQWDLHLRDMIATVLYIHYAGVFYSITLPLLKISILIEWSRMFVPRGTRNAFMWACYIVITVQIMAMIGIVFALCFVCIPYEKIWNITLKGHCFNKLNIDIGAACVHLCTDIVILILPQRPIWRLQMSFRKRLGVSVFFSLGILACISAGFRLAVTLTYAHQPDQTSTFGPVIFWATAEMTCGFVIACLPSTPKILKDHGILRKMKKAMRSVVGLTNTTSKGTASKLPISSSTNPASTYRKLGEYGEYGVEMRNIKTSESTEQLRFENGHAEQGILRTTRVTIKEEYAKDVDEDVLNPNAAWNKETNV